MTAAQETFADMWWATGIFGTHSIAHLRPRLAAADVAESAALRTAEVAGTRTLVHLIQVAAIL